MTINDFVVTGISQHGGDGGKHRRGVKILGVNSPTVGELFDMVTGSAKGPRGLSSKSARCRLS